LPVVLAPSARAPKDTDADGDADGTIVLKLGEVPVRIICARLECKRPRLTVVRSYGKCLIVQSCSRTTPYVQGKRLPSVVWPALGKTLTTQLLDVHQKTAGTCAACCNNNGGMHTIKQRLG
jgi:hypothetical protein